MNIRNVSAEDAKLLYEWRNEEYVRVQSLNSEPLEWEAHQLWLEQTLRNAEIIIRIVEIQAQPIGMFRLNRVTDHDVHISIMVAPAFRGQGLGTQIINCASAACRESFGSVTLHAEIKIDNLPSQKAFLKAGYRVTAYRLELDS